MKKFTQYSFLADENVPLKFVENLKEKGIDIIRSDHIQKGIDDNQVAEIANSENRILITFDKDFGYKTVRENLTVKGLILLRFTPISIKLIEEKFYAIFEKVSDLENKLVVIDDDKIRIRNLKSLGGKDEH